MLASALLVLKCLLPVVLTLKGRNYYSTCSLLGGQVAQGETPSILFLGYHANFFHSGIMFTILWNKSTILSQYYELGLN